ncbi:hypothetical protein ECP03047779_5067 [Escherichia coli P0304777.9]|nr:hypothetical protein ECP03047779_5067 [Escherichia coli P0304777.9]
MSMVARTPDPQRTTSPIPMMGYPISAGAFWPDIVLRTASGGTTAGR